MADATPKDEYLDASENMRTFMNIRFAQLTLFVAITAALLTVLLRGSEASLPEALALALKLGGVLSVIIFAVMEERGSDYFHHYKTRAIALEAQLGFQQYSTRPQRRIVTATNAVRLLFLASGLFWVLLLIQPPWFSY
jgi:hypothetical protein